MSIGGDGWIRLWNINRKIQICQFTRMHGYGTDLHCVHVTESNKDTKTASIILTGDAKGVVTVYDYSRLSPSACLYLSKQQQESPKSPTNVSREGRVQNYIIEQVSFHAHTSGVSSVTYATGKGGLVITSSYDGIIIMWTLSGVKIGIFGM